MVNMLSAEAMSSGLLETKRHAAFVWDPSPRAKGLDHLVLIAGFFFLRVY